MANFELQPLNIPQSEEQNIVNLSSEDLKKINEKFDAIRTKAFTSLFIQEQLSKENKHKSEKIIKEVDNFLQKQDELVSEEQAAVAENKGVLRFIAEKIIPKLPKAAIFALTLWVLSHSSEAISKEVKINKKIVDAEKKNKEKSYALNFVDKNNKKVEKKLTKFDLLDYNKTFKNNGLDVKVIVDDDYMGALMDKDGYGKAFTSYTDGKGQVVAEVVKIVENSLGIEIIKIDDKFVLIYTDLTHQEFAKQPQFGPDISLAGKDFAVGTLDTYIEGDSEQVEGTASLFNLIRYQLSKQK